MSYTRPHSANTKSSVIAAAVTMSMRRQDIWQRRCIREHALLHACFGLVATYESKSSSQPAFSWEWPDENAAGKPLLMHLRQQASPPGASQELAEDVSAVARAWAVIRRRFRLRGVRMLRQLLLGSSFGLVPERLGKNVGWLQSFRKDLHVSRCRLQASLPQARPGGRGSRGGSVSGTAFQSDLWAQTARHTGRATLHRWLLAACAKLSPPGGALAVGIRKGWMQKGRQAPI
jgi:hypothetical protein